MESKNRPSDGHAACSSQNKNKNNHWNCSSWLSIESLNHSFSKYCVSSDAPVKIKQNARPLCSGQVLPTCIKYQVINIFDLAAPMICTATAWYNYVICKALRLKVAVSQLNCPNKQVACYLRWHLVVICHPLFKKLQDMWGDIRMEIPIENSDSVIRKDPTVSCALGWTLGDAQEVPTCLRAAYHLREETHMTIHFYKTA